MRTNYVRKWLLAVGLLLVAGSVNAYDFEVDGFYYSIISQMKKTVEVAPQYENQWSHNYSGDLVIPETVTYNGAEYSVIGIGDYAFANDSGYGSNVTSVVLPDGITYIGKYAFSMNRRMASINIPANVTSIGEFAFCYNDPLTSISVPKTIKSIGNYAFEGCGIATFDWPESITTIGEGMFHSCQSLTSINIPEGVTTIGEKAFSYCYALTNVDFLPNSLTTIGASAFLDCVGVKSITLPENVTSIGENAFQCGNNLKSVFCYPLVPPELGASVFYDSNLPSIVLEVQDEAVRTYAWTEPWSYFNILGYEGIKAGEKFVENGLEYTFLSEEDMTVGVGSKIEQNVTSVTVPEKITYKNKEWTVEAISEYGFSAGTSGWWANQNLETIILPNTIKHVGKFAFQSCYSLTSINIPENVELIDDYAFDYCTNLSSLKTMELPESLTRIGYSAFSNGPIESIVLPSGLQSIGNYAFYYCNNLKQVTCKAKNLPATAGFNDITNVDYYTIFQNSFSMIPQLMVPEESIQAYSVWGFENVLPIATEVSIGSTSYATLFVFEEDLRIPEGVKAYTGKVVKNTDVLFTEVEERIPAGTPVVLQGNEGTYRFVHSSGAGTVGENDLKGTEEPLVADGTQYVLAEKNGVVGFYQAQAGTTIPAGKAYLNITSANVKVLTIGETTGIATTLPQEEESATAIYDLSGRRVEKATKGIYIVNGKKVMK